MKHLDSSWLVAGMVDRQVEALAELVGHGVQPQAHILRTSLGETNPEIRSYTGSLVQHAAELAGRVGLKACDLETVWTVPADEIAPLTRKLNRDSSAHAVIHMSPMEGDVFDEAAALLDPALDVDRMGPMWGNGGWWSRNPVTGVVVPGRIPITAEATQRLLLHHGKIATGTKVAQFGAGRTVGGPLLASLTSRGVDVSVVPRRVTAEERQALLQEAEVVIGAVGNGQTLIMDNELHDGQTVIGVALSDIAGDVYSSNRDIQVTPPHLAENGSWGVGRITAAGFWERTLKNAARRAGIRIRLGEHALVGA